MNRNNKIFQIIISIIALGIAFLLLLCIGICSSKTVVRKAVVDTDGKAVPPFDIPERTLPTYTSSIDYTGSPVKAPIMPRPPDEYNEQMQSFIYYSKATEQKADLFPLVAVIGLFGLNIVMMCSLVYAIESLSKR